MATAPHYPQSPIYRGVTERGEILFSIPQMVTEKKEETST